jgi:histidyl-tRNA synthetase
MTLEPVKGMRDFYPDELYKRNWLFDHFKKTSNIFGFEEYEACVLEHEDLYIRKAGDEITRQLYNFSDKGNRRLSLRPEITPSLARMILKKNINNSLPIRWFTIGQCFRYEKMQTGRKREHYQWNMDIVGEKSLNAESELISAIINLLTTLGLSRKEFIIKVNSRKLLNDFLLKYNISDKDFERYCILIDKIDKIGEDEFKKSLLSEGIGIEIINEIISFIKIKNICEIENFLDKSSSGGFSEILNFFELAKDYSILDCIQFDASIVRGLSYYTGMIFEVYDSKNEYRAIAGGGRYDKLFSLFGGTEIPMVGFGMGDIVISEILNDKNLFPEYNQKKNILVFAYSEKEKNMSIKITDRLRNIGKNVILDLSYKKLDKIISYTNKRGYKEIIIVAPEELKRNQVLIKNMYDRTERNINLDDFFNC